ncbi:hypothetical protein BC829DRAFT_387645 [Chytridium lagenaria]|nr:hypothetical protein BC829DRAFT_387645 [Chytridium lagenaria]
MYSDAASTSFVFVEDTRALDEFKTFDTLKNMKFRETFSGVANLPLVPRNSEIFPDNNYDLSATKFGVPVRREAWFGGRLVNYFDLGPIKSTESATYVKAAPAVYNSEGQTVVSAIPENAATYTGFYGVGRAKAGQLSLTFSEYDTTGFTANMGINNCPIAAIA